MRFCYPPRAYDEKIHWFKSIESEEAQLRAAEALLKDKDFYAYCQGSSAPLPAPTQPLSSSDMLATVLPELPSIGTKTKMISMGPFQEKIKLLFSVLPRNSTLPIYVCHELLGYPEFVVSCNCSGAVPVILVNRVAAKDPNKAVKKTWVRPITETSEWSQQWGAFSKFAKGAYEHFYEGKINGNG